MVKCCVECYIREERKEKHLFFSPTYPVWGLRFLVGVRIEYCAGFVLFQATLGKALPFNYQIGERSTFIILNVTVTKVVLCQALSWSLGSK
jgi:hypothetical protein